MGGPWQRGACVSGVFRQSPLQRKIIVTVSRRSLRTFDNQLGRNVFYRAAIHPMTAPRIEALIERLSQAERIAVYDPTGYFADLAALHDLSGWTVDGIYVQRIEEVGQDRGGFKARPLTELADSTADLLFVAEFDGEALLSRLGPYRPVVAETASLDTLRLEPGWLTSPGRYLDPLNFVSDFLFFRDAEGLHTTVSTTNYWHNHGARETRLWCRLFGADGAELATWEEPLPASPSGISLDSAQIRRRFGLGEFTGSLFVHVIGAALHDTLKYAVDVYDDRGAITTATHDSNPWPADFYAGLPAAAPGQRVNLWVQNCYPTPIPSGGIEIRPMGAPEFKPVTREVPPYGTIAVDAAQYFGDVAWPGQFEIRANKYCCRPRYEIAYDRYRSVAHVNVERSDLKPAPDLPEATRLLGKGFILPGPLLPVAEWSGAVLPTPMATWEDGIALMLRAYDCEGTLQAEFPFGKRARSDQTAVELDSILGRGATLAGGYGHLELGYDFDRGTEGDGWIHAIFRYVRRDTSRQAETSFGSHLFNVPAVWRNEPNSYIGKPPGLTTRLYLRLSDRPGRVLCHLSYPTSGRWRPFSETDLILHSAVGAEITRRRVGIPCSGSRLIELGTLFDPAELREAAGGGYVIIRDATCRLFGYHIFLGAGGGFALDHMFGF